MYIGVRIGTDGKRMYLNPAHVVWVGPIEHAMNGPDFFQLKMEGSEPVRIVGNPDNFVELCERKSNQTIYYGMW